MGHNRLYLVATPMSDELCAEIEKGPAGPKADPKDRVKLLREKFDWDDNEARKIWCWGPETDGANVVVDTTVAIQYLAEIKEHVNSAFPQCVFDHWDNMPGDCMETGGKMQELALAVRKRKNIKVEMPALGDYLDKL